MTFTEAQQPASSGSVTARGFWRSPQFALWSCAGLALVIALVTFSRFSTDVVLHRDEAVYAYAGQQLVEGVPPYVSIAAQKTPLPIALAAVGAAVGRAVGVDDLYGIRWAFFVSSLLTVVAVYFAGVALFSSPIAALAGAATFAAFRGFALDALGGPNAKTPGVLFVALAVALLARRQWFWGAFAAALATLVWQPLVIYPIVAVIAAWLASDRTERWKNGGIALAGAAIPAIVTVASLLASGALDEFIESAVLLPLVGRHTNERSLLHILEVVREGYGIGQFLLWGGLLLLLAMCIDRIWRRRRDVAALRRDPLTVIVLPPLLFMTAFSLRDFQGYSDAYPFLPYAALGVTGGIAALLFLAKRRATPAIGVGITAAATALLVVTTAVLYSSPPAHGLEDQRNEVRYAAGLVEPGAELYAMGDPTPLVLLHRRNPSRFIYLSTGVDTWIVRHTAGGFEGWTREIAATDPQLVLINRWHGPYRHAMIRWLGNRMQRTQVGNWVVFVAPPNDEGSAARG